MMNRCLLPISILPIDLNYLIRRRFVSDFLGKTILSLSWLSLLGACRDCKQVILQCRVRPAPPAAYQYLYFIMIVACFPARNVSFMTSVEKSAVERTAFSVSAMGGIGLMYPHRIVIQSDVMGNYVV